MPDVAADARVYPVPQLKFVGDERYQAEGKTFVRYRYDITNKADYPDALFAPASHLPPCGSNTNSARSWVDIFDMAGNRLYGFCALGTSAKLGSIWFAREEGIKPQSHVYIEIWDRLTGRRYRSNLAGTSLLSRFETIAGSTANSRLLPQPALKYIGEERYAAGGRNWVRLRFDVTNKAAYPDALFVPAPGLPPCGTNTDSSRTWVDFFDSAGNRLYGFCALGASDELGSIWFAVEDGTTPPSLVYIEMTDRQSGRKYRSNLARTAR